MVLNNWETSSQMLSTQQELSKRFPDVDFFKEWPDAKSPQEKTNVVWKVWEYYLKWFTRTWRILWETEHRMIELFNQFSKESNSTFSWPEILESWETDDGWYYFLMEDAKDWDKKELNFSNMSINKILKLYDEYRQTFNWFEEYSEGKTSTESNPTLQKIYALWNRYKNNALFNRIWNPALKLAIGKKYRKKIDERISNGEYNVGTLWLKFERGEINSCFERLLSKVDRINFEYNFWRFWTWHVFSDWTNHKLIDFDNVSYQIAGTELIGIMRSNLLTSVWNYESYDQWKMDYDKWYNKLLEMYGDENIVKLLLFVKLIWTIFEDYWHIIFDKKFPKENKEPDWNGNKLEEIRKWIQRNYKALQELMKE